MLLPGESGDSLAIGSPCWHRLKIQKVTKVFFSFLKSSQCLRWLGIYTRSHQELEVVELVLAACLADITFGAWI